ncbi:MAG: class I SAM-dependent methyltransferase [Acidimicrobiia bacterium]|nr:class I SAM-dependent methyltransferase [Acidimicrobiia bacterium]
MNRSLAAAAMDRAETALAAYYDHEAQARSNRALDPRRIVLRDEFVAMLAAEGRSRVVEVGTGPGRDGAAFIQAGLQVAGVDISSEHVRLARAAGVDAVCASLFDLPYPLSSFDAGWTMKHAGSRRGRPVPRGDGCDLLRAPRRRSAGSGALGRARPRGCERPGRDPAAAVLQPADPCSYPSDARTTRRGGALRDLAVGSRRRMGVPVGSAACPSRRVVVGVRVHRRMMSCVCA